MPMRILKAISAFFKAKCPDCGKRRGTNEACPGCRAFNADSQGYSF